MKDALYEAIHTKYLRIFIIMTSGKFFTSLSKQFVDTCLITQVSFLFYKFCKFNFGQNIHINPEPDRLRDITLTSVSFVILVTNCTFVSYYFFIQLTMVVMFTGFLIIITMLTFQTYLGTIIVCFVLYPSLKVRL